ncbi:putative serine/threonine protein kinase KIN4 PWA37_001611 [Arxiozyma heterogenica]|uniref:non-specific serine/threonine protein kinase n=1 Tax=Arxiozyma heterogenica TaxID=278026 RepID=A0AAN7ZSI8_9SACH|nr:hypothetical protein RI543_002554 [Kazachstania heterogenica]
MNESTSSVKTSLPYDNDENKNLSSQPVKKYVTFGPYIIGSTLGEGEFGKVKLGWTKIASSNEIPKQVAIKLIRRDNLKGNPEKEMKIYREINALKYLNHPNIIKLEEILQNSKYIGIVLEYASGGEFYKYIQRKRRLKENIACKLFSQLISGVGYMHYKGLVHRDLKLENLLLDKDENLIITDFGFVNEFSLQKRLMNTSCGSPCYAAPELVVTTQPYEGTRADTWSCGVILFAMLAGYLPWDDDPANPDGDDIARLYQYITSTPLKFPDYINPLARDLLRKILVADPRKRYTIERIRAHEWLAKYYDFLSISSYDWDVAGKLGSTTLVSPRSTTSNRRPKTRPHSMISNTHNSLTSKFAWEESRIAQLSSSMHKLNILKEDDTEDMTKTPNDEPTLSNILSKDIDINQNFPPHDLKTTNLSNKLVHSKPRPTTLHITINPSLEPVILNDNNTTVTNLRSGNNNKYSKTYSKKSLNQYEPKNIAIIDTINENSSNIDTSTNIKSSFLPIKNQNNKENDYINIKRNSVNVKNVPNDNNPSKKIINKNSNKINTISKSSVETEFNPNKHVYTNNDSKSSFKASSESVSITEKKRFSFLSIHSTYSSAKSSLRSDENGKTSSRPGRSSSINTKQNSNSLHIYLHHPRNISSHQTRVDSRNSAKYPTASPSTVDANDTYRNTGTKENSFTPIDNNLNHASNSIDNKEIVSNTINSNATTKKKSKRSSIMISSLKPDKKKTDAPIRRDSSTARKVIDFFKRKSTIL